MRRMISIQQLLAGLVLVAIPSVTNADHCSDIRKQFNCQLETLEDSYHAERRALTDQYRHQREHLHHRLRRVNRLPECERRQAREALKRHLRAVARAYKNQMKDVADHFVANRRRLIDERDDLVRACRRGACDVCSSHVVVPRQRYRDLRGVRPAVPRDLPDRFDDPRRVAPDGIPPVPTPQTRYRTYRGGPESLDYGRRNGHYGHGPRGPVRPAPSRSLDWGDVVMHLISHRLSR